MMRQAKLFMMGLLLILSAGCSSTYYSGANPYSDDMYATHDRAAIAKQREAVADARRAEWEARLAEANARSEESGSFSDVLVNDYQSAYARRLYAFNSPTYNLPSSYYDLRYSSAYNNVAAYDPAFYNIIVMGDQVWVEPKYITSMFGTWGLPTASTAYAAAGLYSSWYFGWGYPPRYSWAWGYNPYYYYPWGYNPYYYWDWYGYYPWYPPYYYPPHGGRPAAPRPPSYNGGYNNHARPVGGSPARPSYNFKNNRPESSNIGGGGTRRPSDSRLNGGAGNRPSYNGSSPRNNNGGDSSFNRQSNTNINRSNSNSSFNRGSSGGFSGGGGGYSGGSYGGNSRGR